MVAFRRDLKNPKKIEKIDVSLCCSMLKILNESIEYACSILLYSISPPAESFVSLKCGGLGRKINYTTEDIGLVRNFENYCFI